MRPRFSCLHRGESRPQDCGSGKLGVGRGGFAGSTTSVLTWEFPNNPGKGCVCRPRRQMEAHSPSRVLGWGRSALLSKENTVGCFEAPACWAFRAKVLASLPYR